MGVTVRACSPARPAMFVSVELGPYVFSSGTLVHPSHGPAPPAPRSRPEAPGPWPPAPGSPAHPSAWMPDRSPVWIFGVPFFSHLLFPAFQIHRRASQPPTGASKRPPGSRRRPRRPGTQRAKVDERSSFVDGCEGQGCRIHDDGAGRQCQEGVPQRVHCI